MAAKSLRSAEELRAFIEDRDIELRHPRSGPVPPLCDVISGAERRVLVDCCGTTVLNQKTVLDNVICGSRSRMGIISKGDIGSSKHRHDIEDFDELDYFFVERIIDG